MNRKIRVGIIFGGKSAEHEVSLQSAKNIIDAINKEKYEPVLIGVDKQGKWLLSDSSTSLLNSDDPKLIKLNQKASQSVALVPQGKGKLVNLDAPQSDNSIDVAFPVLHGPFGEDGTIQGLLKLANIPFVGAGVLGSAIGMDKDIMKRLLRDAEIPIVKFMAVKKSEVPTYAGAVKELGLPFFVKPANLGSSVGVGKVKNEQDFEKSIREAFSYDKKILLEENIEGREIECSVLGNDSPIASVPGEVIANHDFYSYEAKYIDKHGAKLEIPAKLPKDTIQKIQGLAVRAFKTLACEGMGRVDMFLKANGDIVVNEINTIPGFTSISMYPKLWEASGISYTELIDRLIQLALERFKKEQKIKSSYGGE
ncbi:MAG: D-alanine--D-alanine ligase [Candidatus Saccharimonadales bacterium]